MIPPVDYDLRLVAGDDLIFEVAFTTLAGAPIDVTGREFSAYIARTPGATPAVVAVIGVQAAEGIVEVAASGSETALLEPGAVYWWTFRYTSELVPYGVTVLRGRVTIEEPV